jgi:hypothetical protein
MPVPRLAGLGRRLGIAVATPQIAPITSHIVPVYRTCGLDEDAASSRRLMRMTRWRTRAADQDPRPESVGILRAVSAAARALESTRPQFGQDGRQAGGASVSLVGLGLGAGVAFGAGLDHLASIPGCSQVHTAALYLRRLIS